MTDDDLAEIERLWHAGKGLVDAGQADTDERRVITARIIVKVPSLVHEARGRGRLAAAWESVHRALNTYRRHSFAAEWNAYEAAIVELASAGGPDLRAEEEADSWRQRS